MWSGYTNIATKGYIHKTVNHSKNFVNPVDGTHTQKIERFWRGLKDVRRRYQGMGVCSFSPEKSEISRTFPGSWNTEARGLKLMGIIAMPKNKKTQFFLVPIIKR